MAIMSAAKGTDYIFLHVSPSLPVNLQTQPATAPAFTILRRLISRSGSPQHTVLIYQPGVEITAAPGNPNRGKRLKSTIKECTPRLCTCTRKFALALPEIQTPRGVRIAIDSFFDLLRGIEGNLASPYQIQSGPVRDLLFLVPGHAALHCSFAPNWADLPHPPYVQMLSQDHIDGVPAKCIR